MGELTPERAVLGSLTDDGLRLAPALVPFADWLTGSDDQEDRWQAEALRALDTTAIDPKYLNQRFAVWAATARP